MKLILPILCTTFILLFSSNAHAEPPKHKKWVLTFQDEFSGQKLDESKWSVENASPGHIMSSRWADNILVDGGVCRILTKKQKRGSKEWTTGYLWTKHFAQKYGYYEARYKIGTSAGLNNAFWLMTNGKSSDPIHFEIDINEGKYPDIVSTNLHNWSGKHWDRHENYHAGMDLSKDYHVYGLEWDEKQIKWYFDGNVIRTMNNSIAHREATVRFSTAVVKWAGEVTDKLDGTMMAIDYVRIYKADDSR